MDKLDLNALPRLLQEVESLLLDMESDRSAVRQDRIVRLRRRMTEEIAGAWIKDGEALEGAAWSIIDDSGLRTLPSGDPFLFMRREDARDVLRRLKTDQSGAWQKARIRKVHFGMLVLPQK
ncbi:hypothetical protein [Sinimarinibacterium sp. NLF-5-8]|uniref:hypothetical protein n=1 Tax=Sinimarinibacterium sp. NLF-5-8 TaxID=2698684 RepID=UPI00137C325E|nr:hypothetical protein [Sinimarinibacterium sp. NLF-5-8]QHS09050.1 hypothetical protein GT972_02080 [Sinimarinibacterium sp. NLF-5-8]